MTSKSLMERREQVLGTGAKLFYQTPLELVRGEGVYLFDAAGKRYLDLYNNVPCVGHANAEVAEAMARQQATLNVHSRYLHRGIVEFAERLTKLHAPGIESVVFSCSGTEANEVALRMARLATGRRGVICTNATYHGNSEAVGALSRPPQSANSEIRAIPFPQTYRPLLPNLDEAELTDVYLYNLQTEIERLTADGTGLAGLIICSIFANEGLPDVPGRFMERAAEMVRDAGGLVIADEVQAGYGRTGWWWGYERAGFTPDIVVTGKPMGNGLPLAATSASKRLVDGFRAATNYFNTFASSPLQAAVGQAVLDVIERDGLRENATKVGVALKRAMVERMSRYPAIGDVRGDGLFVVVELVSDRERKTPDRDCAIDVVNRLKEKGVLTSNAGVFGNVLKLRPPLIFKEHHMSAFLAAFDETMAEIDG